MRKNLLPRLWRARDGLGAIEFGFIAPVLLTLLLGILDFGMAFWQEMEISNAADAGAQWGMSNTYDAPIDQTSPSIQSVAQSATNLSGITVSSTNPCGCPTSSGVTVYSCGSTCPDSTTPQPYIVVNTHICYSTLFTWPGLTYCSSGNSACTGCSSNQISLGAQSVVLK